MKLSLALPVLLLLVAGGIFVQAALKRLGERAAAWALPDGQALSFRVAWLLVRLTELMAPKVRKHWRGMTPSGPDYQQSPSRWSAPEEARADLEANLDAEERVAAPVRLVLPLFAEALRMRASNGWNRFQRVTVVFALIAALLLLALPLAIFDLARASTGPLRRRSRGRDH